MELRTWPKVFDGWTLMHAMELAEELAVVKRLLDDFCHEKDMQNAGYICNDIRRRLVKASRSAATMHYSVERKD